MKAEPHFASLAEIEKVMTADGQAQLSIIGAAAITAVAVKAGHNSRYRAEMLRQPKMRPVRLAFGIFDRVRTGELPTWTCLLCEVTRRGVKDLSCLAVVDHAGDDAKKPALTALICMPCDSISEADTIARIREGLGFEPSP